MCQSTDMDIKYHVSQRRKSVLYRKSLIEGVKFKLDLEKWEAKISEKNSISKSAEVRKHKVYLGQMNQTTSLEQRAWEIRGEMEWQVKRTHKCQIKGFYLGRQYEVMVKRSDLLLNLSEPVSPFVK